MTDKRDNNDVAGSSEDSSKSGHGRASGLARPLQEHLAQQLRSTYQTMAEKPAFLGDPAVPAEFEQHLQRLEAVERGRQREKVRSQGVEAVRTALEDIITGPLDEAAASPKERKRDGR
jgi:hypothetical protein